MANPVPTSSTIRPATLSDALRLEMLWTAFLDEMAAHDARFARADDAPRRWRNDYSEWLSDAGRCLLVAEVGGAVEGFVSAHLWMPPPVYEGPLEAYIDELYVVPAHRGGGHGGALVAEVRGWSIEAGAARLRVGTLAAAGAARAFWEHAGGAAFSITYTIDLPPPAGKKEATRRRKIGF